MIEIKDYENVIRKLLVGYRPHAEAILGNVSHKEAEEIRKVLQEADGILGGRKPTSLERKQTLTERFEG